MPDYTKGTGQGGSMLIRDDGSNIEFLIRAGFSTTNGTVNWSGQVNGQNFGGSKAYPTGQPWVSLGSWSVTTGQEVTFSIAATGTDGLGGPTEFKQVISRGSRPSPPVNLRVEVQTPTRLGIRYERGADNGSAFIRDGAKWYEIPTTGDPIQIWEDTGNDGYTDTNDGNPGPILKPGTTYDIYIFSINGAGQSDPAAIRTTTAGGASIKVDGVYRKVIPYIKIDGVYKMATSYVKHEGAYRATT